MEQPACAMRKCRARMRKAWMLPGLFCLMLLAAIFDPGIPLLAQHPNQIQAANPAEPCQVLKNFSYKSGADLDAYEKARGFLDLYLPSLQAHFPVLVWFHGGSLKFSSKDDAATQKLAQHFAQHGVAVAVPNYRLSPQAKYPAYIEDAAQAVAWVIQHLPEYGGNPHALFISGHSAGGYLAAILGLDSRYLEACGVPLTAIAGILPVSGQTFTHYTIREERGIPNPENTPVIDAAAPCYHVRKDAPPVLAICGDHDSADRIEENRYLIAMLKKVGHPDAAYQEMPARNHIELIQYIPNPGDPVTQAVLTFIARHAPGR